MSLYIVPTPIGNLKDITLRAIATLTNAELIIAEDTRYSRKLLSHLGLRKKVISYHRHREREQVSKIIPLLKKHDAALITDSGTPLISDPGWILIKAAIACDLEVVVLPGPTAFVPALVISGIDPRSFLFLGFPPRKSGELSRFLMGIKNVSQTLIFYESPRRAVGLLQAAAMILGDREFALVKELSKKNEKVIRGRLGDLQTATGSEKMLGEMVIVVAGRDPSQNSDEIPSINNRDDLYRYFKENLGISKNRLKQIIMKRGKEPGGRL